MKLPEEERLKAYLGYFYDLLTPDQRAAEKQKMLEFEKSSEKTVYKDMRYSKKVA